MTITKNVTLSDTTNGIKITPTTFGASYDNTKYWLRNIIIQTPNPSRALIYFKIADTDDYILVDAGVLANSLIIDNVIPSFWLKSNNGAAVAGLIATVYQRSGFIS